MSARYPVFYAEPGTGELRPDRRCDRSNMIRRRHRYRLIQLWAVVIALAIALVVQSYHRHAAEIAAKPTNCKKPEKMVEHRVDQSQRDEEIGSLYDPENRWLCRHIPA